MDKGPRRLLHMNQPTMHSINVTNLICNDPTIPRRQKLGRFRNVTRATRTLPCNVIKRAKFSATIPNAHGGRTMRHPTTKSSRRESGTTSQGPSFRTGSSKLTGSMPVNPTKITGSIVKHSSWASRRSDAMCRRKHQARQASRTTCWRWPMSPAEERSKRQPESEWAHFHSAVRSQPCEANQESKAWAGEPRQVDQVKARDFCPLQARKNPHKLGGKQHIKMHDPAKQGSTQPNRRSTNATTSNMHQTPQLWLVWGDAPILWSPWCGWDSVHRTLIWEHSLCGSPGQDLIWFTWFRPTTSATGAAVTTFSLRLSKVLLLLLLLLTCHWQLVLQASTNSFHRSKSPNPSPRP